MARLTIADCQKKIDKLEALNKTLWKDNVILTKKFNALREASIEEAVTASVRTASILFEVAIKALTE